MRPVCKPVQAESEIAYAERRVKPLARLLRCATALRVTAPHGCGSRRWYGRKVPFRPGKHGPKIHPVVSFWAHRHLWLSNAIK